MSNQLDETATWSSLVSRSIAAWDELDLDPEVRKDIATSMLQDCISLNDFLSRGGSPVMLWFFQSRDVFLTQSRMTKWSPHNLDDYVLLPALPGFVLRKDCFFVSHFWESPDNPDPHGKYLRLNQDNLKSQTWSYIWVDWTCMPQQPRSPCEEKYFNRSLQTMSGIIRNCGFCYHYPPFQPKLWILYELAEYSLTCDMRLPTTPDVRRFFKHMNEMTTRGVKKTLNRHKYFCRHKEDREFLESRMGLLVLLRRLKVDNAIIRKIMDAITWQPEFPVQVIGDNIRVARFEGVVEVDGVEHSFTPFPRLAGIYTAIHYASSFEEALEISSIEEESQGEEQTLQETLKNEAPSLEVSKSDAPISDIPKNDGPLPEISRSRFGTLGATMIALSTALAVWIMIYK